MNPSIHVEPEFRDLIPPLTADEYSQLEQNLLRDGCRDPLSMWHEILLDGHNRYEICSRHGIPFQTKQIDGLETLEDAVLWVVRNQLGRRNLTDFVRAELALKSKDILATVALANYEASLIKGGTVPQNSAAPVKVETREEVAKLAGLSHDTVRKVEKIKQEAAPAVVEAARNGEVSINAAAKVAALPVDQQKAIASAGLQAIKQAAADQRAVSRAASAKPSANEPAADISVINDRLGALEEQLGESLSQISALRAENESLQRIVSADDKVAAALTEIQAARDDASQAIAQKEAEIASLRERLAGLMNEKNEAVRMVKALQRKQGRAVA
ncbi:hypothetical protein [Cupriavidus metallidurans]|jgi:chromosome segregation ATPase|uniref:Plasmid replication/partition related protein n=1 Tax=Cupriavidus metallidurans TaxID=119219 RepID=A0A482ISA6_9BURK|nr:hypothetical protein [Cupriavidus metallidurans]QBP10447.1 hypothetical protein DDF84_012140 [Cupriavidus metallidurans]QWC87523.1 hypothetical protein KB891_10695 [Cupriavidus metallidurans]